MRKFSVLYIIVFFVVMVGCKKTETMEFSSSAFTIQINGEGKVIALLDAKGVNYIPSGMEPYLMQVRSDSVYYTPIAAKTSINGIELNYEDFKAEIKVVENSSHITFELEKITPFEEVDLVVWGPFPTDISEIIGETVGVVRGEEYAIGIQALNIKTIGGYPWKENDAMPEIDIFESGNYGDLKEEGKRHVLYRVEAAKPEEYGSSLQAYTRNRLGPRIVENINHDYYLAPALEDGGVVGSKIALFGCPVDQTLDYLEKIELEENLPHPMIDGEWGKRSRAASSAYLIMDFSENTLQKALDYTKMAGLKYLYHSGPFKTWGHFELNSDFFPNGLEGLKNLVDIAEKNGVHLGVHTLSNFITTNDKYVSPVPDERLAEVGYSVLSESIGVELREIPIEDPLFFDQFRNNNLKTIRIGQELIRYNKVSTMPPYTLLECERGVFGTTASEHQKGDRVAKLADHGYKVFLSNTELTKEISRNLAALFNETGLRQISFDGLEGNRSTGMGNYGESLMPATWYNSLNDNIKEHYIADASRTTHYFWHIFTRMNWGEPWYAGFRESQTEYRLKNQEYFKRNMIPGMLGWFLLRPDTSIEDIEWLLAKSAAFNAGFAFVCNFDALESNGQTEEILNLIKQYESLRMRDQFSREQLEAMSDPAKEFHLLNGSETDWELLEYFVRRFTHSSTPKQPGEPQSTSFVFDNPFGQQPLQFILTAPENADLSDIKLEIDNFAQIDIPLKVPASYKLKYSGGSSATLYDMNGNRISTVPMAKELLSIKSGPQSVSIDATFTGSGEHQLNLEIKTQTLIK